MPRNPGFLILACSLAAAVPAVRGQVAEPIVAPSMLAGAWTLVRVDNVQPDGTRTALYGPHPQGLLLIDAQGHYALQMVRAQRAGFAAGDKAKGTPQEYRAAALDGNAHYGRVEMAAGMLRFHIEHASFPNWDGKEQRRPFTLHGGELTYTVPAPTSGAGRATGEVSWRRLP